MENPSESMRDLQQDTPASQESTVLQWPSQNLQPHQASLEMALIDAEAIWRDEWPKSPDPDVCGHQ